MSPLRTRIAATTVCLLAVLALLLAAFPLSGCGLFGGGATPPTGGTGTGASGGTVATETSPPTNTGSTATTPEPPARKIGVKAYFALDEKVQPAYRSVPGTSAVIKAAVTQLLKGPTTSEKAKGLSSEVPAGTKLRGVSLKNGVAYVDLTGKFGSGGGSLSMTLRLAELVYTATQFPSVKSMVLKMDGKVVDVFSGEGIELNGQPQTRADYEDYTPAILVDTPAWGATVHEPARLRGTANVFEAQFTVQVIGPNGKVVGTKHVTASSGTGTRGSWTASIPYSIATSGWGKIRAFDSSEKDGSPTDVVTVPVYLVK